MSDFRNFEAWQSHYVNLLDEDLRDEDGELTDTGRMVFHTAYAQGNAFVEGLTPEEYIEGSEVAAAFQDAAAAAAAERLEDEDNAEVRATQAARKATEAGEDPVQAAGEARAEAEAAAAEGEDTEDDRPVKTDGEPVFGDRGPEDEDRPPNSQPEQPFFASEEKPGVEGENFGAPREDV